jgi:arabinofuranosyltransferase
MFAAAGALPVASQLFRMAYYANVVPNTALAKAASGSRWGQGWYYLVNTVGPYALAVPLLAMVVWAVVVRRRRFATMFGGRDGLVLVALLVGAALAHVLYVVRVGGDYMHARMLLVPLFALCCPFAVVPLPRSSARRGAAIGTLTVMGGWALLVLLALRAPDPGGFFDEASIAEQRVFYTQLAGAEHPVTLDDWRRSPTYLVGEGARMSAAAGEDVLVTSVSFGDLDWPNRVQTAPGSGTSVFADGIGVLGARAGTDVHIIDLHGLAHPLAARMPILEPRVLPGHERALPLPWALAEGGYVAEPGSDAALARVARRCGPAGEVVRAVTGPLGLGDLLGNVLAAPSLARQEVPKDPAEAVDACGGLRLDGGVGGS